MSKGLEALNGLVACAKTGSSQEICLEIDKLKQKIENELKALEIIIKYVGASYISYLMRIGNADRREIELVEEVLHENK